MILVATLCLAAFQVLTALAQTPLPDSLRTAILKDARVTGLRYATITRINGTVEMEGWLFASMYFPHFDGKRYSDTIEHRVGEWRFYRKDGSVRQIDLRPFSDTMPNEVRYFKKNGWHFMTKWVRDDENRNKLTTHEDFGTSFPLRFRVVRYHRNGGVKYSQQQEGIKTVGEYLEYFESGTLKHRWNYDAEGRTHGPAFDYYPDGTVKWQGQYDHGRKVGDFIKRRPDGSIRKKRSYPTVAHH